MYRVNQDTKDAFKAYGGHKEVEIRIPELDITLTNTDIVAQSLSLTESIESSENLTFTGCIASCLKFKCVDIIQDIKGQYIECDITPENCETVPLFRGYIDSVTNSSHEQMTMDIVAYDALYKINELDVTSWYNSLTFPISIKNMRDSFFTYVGIQQKADYLSNDGMSVYKTLDNKTIKGADIIKPICQINGRYGKIGRTGLFEYVQLVEGTEALYPREDLYPADDIYPSAENALDNVSKAHYMGINFENYRVTPIDKVQLIGKDGSIVATAGSGSNIFTVENNPLIYSKTQADLNAVATNLYNDIQGLWYTPADVVAVGLPYVETGDFVMCATKRSIIRAYVLNRTLTGEQALKDNYKAEGDLTQPAYTPNIQTQVNANRSAISSEISRASYAENQIRSDVTRVNYLVAQKADISELNVVKADINTLNVTKLNASQFNAGTISAMNITVRAANITGTLNANQINTSNLKIGSHNITGTASIRFVYDWATTTINGKSVVSTCYTRTARVLGVD